MEKTLGCTRDGKYVNVNIMSSTTERMNIDKSEDIFRGHYYVDLGGYRKILL